jgi:hypothetical protein
MHWGAIALCTYRNATSQETHKPNFQESKISTAKPVSHPIHIHTKQGQVELNV